MTTIQSPHSLSSRSLFSHSLCVLVTLSSGHLRAHLSRRPSFAWFQASSFPENIKHNCSSSSYYENEAQLVQLIFKPQYADMTSGISSHYRRYV